MKRIFGKKACFSVFCVLLTLGMALSAQGFDMAIDVAPNVLNIQSQGTVVTVHTDIAYGLVYASSVTLNGVKLDWWKVDNRGNFVAKFLMKEVKELDGLIIGDYNLLTLFGVDIDGQPFSGEQEIKVIDVEPAAGR